jgi:membrane-bound acyltransferase YfiQ involved in biofilm formation
MTGLAGLPVYMDLASVMGLKESMARHFCIAVENNVIFMLYTLCTNGIPKGVMCRYGKTQVKLISIIVDGGTVDARG